jgi:protein SCO1/2
MTLIINLLFVIIVGSTSLYFASSGFQAFTTESERRLRIEEKPTSLPTVELISSDGKVFKLQDYAGKYVFVDFIFSNCREICPAITQSFIRLNQALDQERNNRHYALLSITFDSEYDSISILQRHATALGADPEKWVFARVHDETELQLVLDAFGIIVIPRPDGQFEHNAAIHLLNKESQLAKIYDFEDTDMILQDWKKLLSTSLESNKPI